MSSDIDDMSVLSGVLQREDIVVVHDFSDSDEVQRILDDKYKP